jgi:hypothetical protein
VGSVNTTVHKDGTVTYHFGEESALGDPELQIGAEELVFEVVHGTNSKLHERDGLQDSHQNGAMPAGVALAHAEQASNGPNSMQLSERSMLPVLDSPLQVTQPADTSAAAMWLQKGTAHSVTEEATAAAVHSAMRVFVPPEVIKPRPDEDRRRQHQRASFSGRHQDALRVRHFAPHGV